MDILVCNARIDPYKRPPELSDGDWFDTVIGVNLKGPYLCGLAALEQMKKRGGGRIVNISSVWAYRSAKRSMVEYALPFPRRTGRGARRHRQRRRAGNDPLRRTRRPAHPGRDFRHD